MIIAIDGPVGSGKSATGRRVAEALGLTFVDSGLYYRAVACLALAAGLDGSDGDAVVRLAAWRRIRVEGRRVWSDGEEVTARVYLPGVDEVASKLAAIPGVRDAMVAQQRRLGEAGVVMAGRDIGTVVFPTADLKLFLTAGLEERARRRGLQYQKRGEHPDPTEVARDVAARDRADTERPVAPLRPASDAVVIDSDGLDLEQVVDMIVRLARPAP
ncbi:MAG: (d)CMP kinase [Candidatus Dormibacteraceae bacterium]